jgi:hypothetical protein
MADLRRVFSDVGRVQAQLEAAVSLRLQGEFGLPLVLFESMTAIADTDSCRVRELANGLGSSPASASARRFGSPSGWPSPDMSAASIMLKARTTLLVGR